MIAAALNLCKGGERNSVLLLFSNIFVLIYCDLLSFILGTVEIVSSPLEGLVSMAGLSSWKVMRFIA